MQLRGRSRWFPPLLGVPAALALVAGCGSSALTHSPSQHSAPTASRPTAVPAASAVTSAVLKLDLISQDGCQTDPAEEIYPSCDRFLAELRSAVGTVRTGAASLPNGPDVTATADRITAASDAFDRDGCGSGPYASGPENAGRCSADLTGVRAGLATMLQQTRGNQGR
ncbi:MAG TPA: hypothetical protein VGH99_05465 [Pseudonocardia sp.]|jgi:hypothetical protein